MTYTKDQERQISEAMADWRNGKTLKDMHLKYPAGAVETAIARVMEGQKIAVRAEEGSK